MGLSADIATVRALIRRAGNEILRVPGAAIPGVLAPTIFFLGLTAVFGNLTRLPGFDTESYQSFILPVSLLQGAGFTGAATGVNLARDIEQGWFDRLLASPAPRPALLAGMVLSASLRSLIPATVLLAVGFAIGVDWPGFGGLVLAIFCVMATGTIAACWGVTLALRYRTQSAAPLMQAGMFILVLITTAYAPLELLQGWLADIARINPLTQVVDAARQGFVGDPITWAATWPALVALGGLLAVLSVLRPARHAPDHPLRWTGERARRPLPRRARGQPRRGRAARRALLLHAAEPEPLPVAVVLGLVLRGDRLAAVRRPSARAPSSRPCWPRCARTASSATSSSGTGR